MVFVYNNPLAYICDIHGTKKKTPRVSIIDAN